MRRGLLGEIVKGISVFFNNSPVVYVAWIKISCCFVLFSYLMRRLIASQIRLVNLLFLASPWALMFYLNDPLGAERKELLLLAFYCLFLWFEKEKSHDLVTSVVLCLCLPILVLIHEGLYFFLPFFAFYYIVAERSIPDIAKIIIPSFISSTIAFAFSLMYRGTVAQSEEICLSIVERGLPRDICNGAISALAGFVPHFNNGYLKVYGLAVLLTFVPIIICIFNEARNPRRILGMLSLCIVATVPLYVVAIDWGRWISATAILTVLTLQIKNRSNSDLYSIKKVRAVVIVLAFFYLFNWRLPHCCVDENRFIYSNNVKWWIASFWPSPP